MVARAAELARDSHARTRHAAVLVKDGSMLGWGTNGVPYPGEDHCYCKVGDFGQHDQCRIHAEQRAITLAREGDGWRLLPGAKLIYVRLEADDSVRLDEPHFCARCSRLALSLGVAEWIFALSEGLVGYDARCRVSASESGRGKSELRRAVCRITSGIAASRPRDGQCHREYTARVSQETKVRVKRCGKSAPRCR